MSKGDAPAVERIIANTINETTRGDPDDLAARVVASFQYAHDHPNEPAALLNVRTAVEDYVNRGLRLGELYELAGKYGHRVDGEDQLPTRVFVPGSLRRQ